jgi:hypothetical protein
MRYWYLTKKTKEPRVFTQYPNGYDVYIGEKIHRRPEDGHFIHTLYDRRSDKVIKEFDDHGNCGFDCSRKVIAQELDAMNNFPIRARKARKDKVSVKRLMKKSIQKRIKKSGRKSK